MRMAAAATWDAASLASLRLVRLFAVALAALACGFLVHRLGFWSLLLPSYFLAALTAIAWPRASAIGLLAIGVIVEPSMFDATEPLGDAIYAMPAGWEQALGLTIAPYEVALLLAAASVALRQGDSIDLRRLPLVLWASAGAVAFGVAFGLHRGGDYVHIYHEARGIIFGAAAFVIVLRCGRSLARPGIIAILISTAVLAVIALVRYFVFVRAGTLPVPVEFAYAHETPLLMTIGLVLAGGVAATRPGKGLKALMILEMALLFCALIVTGRRAGTLVVIVGSLTMWTFLLPRRPYLAAGLALMGGLVLAAYLPVYWNKEYGALAQPARAIRSQISPSARDEQSDQYRVIERANVLQTIQTSPVFGIGFGKPFQQFQPQPDLTSFWPLQQYTPHQNALWLWLKLGIGGAGTVLALFAVCIRRAINMARVAPVSDGRWLLATTVCATVLMYLTYSTVDLAFASTRSIAPLMAALALALSFNGGRDPGEAIETGEPEPLPRQLQPETSKSRWQL